MRQCLTQKGQKYYYGDIIQKSKGVKDMWGKKNQGGR